MKTVCKASFFHLICIFFFFRIMERIAKNTKPTIQALGRACKKYPKTLPLFISILKKLYISKNISSSPNSSLSIPILKIPDISRKIAVLMLRFRLLSLVFALIRQNKGKLFFFTRRPPYPAVLRRSVLLPLSRVRRYSSWYSHPHVPEVPERPLAVRRLRAGYS